GLLGGREKRSQEGREGGHGQVVGAEEDGEAGGGGAERHSEEVAAGEEKEDGLHGGEEETAGELAEEDRAPRQRQGGLPADHPLALFEGEEDGAVDEGHHEDGHGQRPRNALGEPSRHRVATTRGR